MLREDETETLILFIVYFLSLYFFLNKYKIGVNNILLP